MLPILIALTVALFGWYLVEYAVHVRNRQAIRLRIHVNGTRGKSSVSRLIGAGLRAGGLRTIVKTTGSAARVILEDGTERPVARPGPPRVIEQLRIFRIAAARRADAIVLECMALQPLLQYLSERQIVRAHVAVITNVRPDHLDVMGPTLDGVARALAGVVPSGGTLVASQSAYDGFFRRACEEKRSRLRLVGQEEVSRITEADLARFGYIEHAENVAVALAACEAAGVDRQTALEGMFHVQPDVGALRVCHGRTPRGSWTFADGFAANDPQSNIVLWEMLNARYPDCSKRIVVVNCRPDRLLRSRQMGQLMADRLQADHYVVVGEATHPAIRTAQRAGLAPSRVLDLEGQPAERVLSRLLELVEGPTLIVGLGNIRGVGEALSGRFRALGAPHG